MYVRECSNVCAGAFECICRSVKMIIDYDVYTIIVYIYDQTYRV